MADSHTAQLASLLHEALKNSGAVAKRDGDALVIAGTDMRLSGALVSEQTSSGRVNVQLDVRFQIGPGRVLVESCAGVGDSVDAAFQDAIQSFADNALHVLLAAFARVGEDKVRKLRWNSGASVFRALLGDVTVRGAPPDAGVPIGWLSEEVEAAVREASLLRRTHWLRVYCARTAPGQLVSEVVLDNEPWPELATRLSAWPWPPGTGSYSVRVFLVLDAGFDTSRAVAALYRLRDRPDLEIVRALVAQGATAAHAEKLVDFVPIAFGRPVLERMGVRASDRGVFVEGNIERSFRLLDDPLFADASALARDAYARGTVPSDLFQAIAMRGAELAAVSEALASGASTRNLTLSPPRFTNSAAMS
jgi:hypothetical protein